MQAVSAVDAAYKAADALINSDILELKAQNSELSQSIAALDYSYRAADEGLQQATLYSTSGMLLGHHEAENGTIQISGLTRGVYILHVTASGNNTTHKIVIR